ncbi:MAG: FosX/FosE/FosI family fosfomycin resistance hydrolase [Xanthobacteraceae bacterium]
MIEGLSHITFIVKDLERMKLLLVGALSGKEVYDSGDKQFSISREKFFEVGGIWIAAMEGDPLSEQTYNHVAFKVPPEDLPSYRAAIEKLGLPIREPRPRIEGEGRSLYFYDFDNHLFELHTATLAERLRTYARSE